MRTGILLIALAVIGLGGDLWLYPQLMQSVWEPLDAPLSVAARDTRTPGFRAAARYPYEIYLYVKQSVPYADCLLGQVASTYANAFLDCEHHKSAVNVTYTVRELQGRVVAHGRSAGTCCTYVGNEVGTKIGGFSVPRTTTASVVLEYNSSPAILAKLDPHVEIDVAEEVTESAGVAEALIALPLLATFAIGLIVVVAFGVSGYLWRHRRAA